MNFAGEIDGSPVGRAIAFVLGVGLLFLGGIYLIRLGARAIGSGEFIDQRTGVPIRGRAARLMAWTVLGIGVSGLLAGAAVAVIVARR